MSITQPKLNINDEQISYIITGGADGDIHFMTMNWTKVCRIIIILKSNLDFNMSNR